MAAGGPFADLLWETRTALCISQAELAARVRRSARAEGQRAAITRQAINRYEHHGLVPRPDTCRWLASALGMPAALLAAAAGEQRRRTVPVTLPSADEGLVTLAFDDLPVLDPPVRRREFFALSGVGLLSFVSGIAFQRQEPTSVTAEGQRVVERATSGIELLWSLDDAEGGASHLGFADAELRAITVLAQSPTLPPSIREQLVAAVAVLCQQAGWMALDAGQWARAQRYYLTGLRFSERQFVDPEISAHIIADLCYGLAASQRDFTEAVRLGFVAAEGAATSTGPVRASILTRLAYAQAVSGDLRGFEVSRDSAREAMEQGSRSPTPGWAYFMTASHVETQSAYGLIHAGRRAGRTDLIRSGTAVLEEKGAHHPDSPDHSRRRALFEGSWLALGLASEGDTKGACEVAESAIRRLDRVRSPRSAALLQHVAAELSRRPRDRYARAFLPHLRQALVGEPS